MLHHYTEFMERDLIANAEQNVAQLISDYHALLNNSYSDSARSHTSVLAAAARVPPLVDVKKLFPAF
jgi:hypothetical protein